MTNHTQTHTGRIYVACLASYNAGILHGEWIEATADADELKARVQAMLDRSPEPYAEEWAIHDFEGFGRMSEYEDLDHIAERVECWEELGQEAVEAYVSNCGTWNKERFEDHYCGAIPAHQEDKKNWCTDQFMECCPLSGHEREFFETWCDWEKIARNWAFSYTFVEYGGQYHIFSE